jgi:integrase
MNRNSTYITKNRLGIYYFQYTIRFSRNFDETVSKYLLRKSLKTRNKREALLRARYLWILMETINKKHFKSSETFSRAMKLLWEYDSIQFESWDVIERFLSELDKDDTELLELAIQDQNERNIITKDDVVLKRQIAGLKTSDYDEELVDEYLSKLVDKWKLIKQETVRKSTYETQIRRVDKFVDFVISENGKDILISKLTKLTMRQFLEYLKRNNKIKPTTIGYYLQVISEFMGWLELEGYRISSLIIKQLSGLKNEITKIKKQVKTKSKDRFNDKDLELIFNSKDYCSGLFKRSSEYWVLLIALYTGARLGEIAQLNLDDIKNIDGDWVFDFNDDEDKVLKSKKGSTRQCLVHKELIKLGLIDFKKELEKKKYKKLFNFEERNNIGKYDALQKRLSTYLKKVGIKSTNTEQKSFHNFRHNMRTRLVEMDVSERTIDSIVGHISKERSVGSSSYTHTKITQQEKDAINKLKFNIDFTKIRRWRACAFSKCELDL